VGDQETNGTELSIEALEIEESGWVVVYRDPTVLQTPTPGSDGGGGVTPPGGELTPPGGGDVTPIAGGDNQMTIPGGGGTATSTGTATPEPIDRDRILGWREVPAGSHEDLTVELQRPVIGTEGVRAVLTYVDPSDEAFNIPRGSPGEPPLFPISAAGEPVTDSFVARLREGVVVAWDNTFYPHQVDIAPGETVTWNNADDTTHNVVSATFNDQSESWGKFSTLDAGATTEHTFSERGVYEYQCTIHGQTTMCGIVTVGRVRLDDDFESPCADQYEEDDDSSGGGGFGGGGGELTPP
jgi:plastocyanin